MGVKIVRTESVRCYRCGKERSHEILSEHRDQDVIDQNQEGSWFDHKILKCVGCDTIKFRRLRFLKKQDDGSISGEDDLFPDDYEKRHPGLDLESNPSTPSIILRMYQETLACLNAGANTLAGAGLRAIVEAVCIQAGAKGKNLMTKIDALVPLGILTTDQAESLHEARYLGNAALHEIQEPSKEDLRDVTDIVESMLRQKFIMPIVTERLKKKRSKQK